MTAIHRMVERCRAADFPALVTRLRSGWVIMGEKQVFPGYCLLLADPVVPHLNQLNEPDRAQFLADMARVGDVVLTLTAALRINYALFGNQEPALHAHIFPRFDDEPADTRGLQPWALDWSLAPDHSTLMYGDLQCRIAEKLESDR